MKKRVFAVLSVVLCAACVFVAVLYASAFHTASSVCDDALYTVRDGKVAVYDAFSRSMCALPVEQRVYSMCSAGNSNIWLLAASDAAAELLLWDGEQITRTVPLDFRPLAVRAYQSGVLLVRQHPWEKMTDYLQQGVSMSAVTADILYLDTNTMKQTKITECGFPRYSAQGECFAVYADEITFRSPSLRLDGNRVLCDDRLVCVYTSDGSMREVPLSLEAEIRDLYVMYDGFAAIGRKGLFAFSPENGLGESLLSRKNLPRGAFSSDGRFYLYIKRYGMFGDKECLHAVRLSDGCTVRLWRRNHIADDVFSTIYFL